MATSFACGAGENYFASHAPSHAWWYFPRMEPSEAMIIKQWDSAGDLASKGRESTRGSASGAGVGGPVSTFALHSAFADPSSPEGAPPRESIEVRCVVLY